MIKNFIFISRIIRSKIINAFSDPNLDAISMANQICIQIDKLNKETNKKYVILGTGIFGFTNRKLIEEVKKLKRDFTPEFKEWYIQMKAKFDNGLPLHGDENDWWWKPAMRIQMPGVKFPGEEGY